MSSGVVAELEALLTAMAAGKAPGVSGSKIAAVTALCLQNVQSESVLIQKIYTHFKKTPGTHKLGVLYVVDSVTRKWLDHAKTQGQVISNGAIDGTYAAGVNRVTGLMSGLMSDMISTAPMDQKEKIEKLIGIWDRVQLFSPDMLEDFRHKLNNMGNTSSQAQSTTPPGSPPRNVGLPGRPETLSASAAPTGAADIMKALAKIAQKPPTSTQAPVPAQAPASRTTIASPTVSQQPPALSQILGKLAGGTNPQNGQTGQNGQPSSYSQGYPQALAPQPMNHAQSSIPGYAATTAALAGNMPAVANPYMTQAPVAAAPFSGYVNSYLPLAGVLSNPPAGAGLPPEMQQMDPDTQQKVLIIKALMEQGIPGDRIPAILASLPGMAGPGAAAGGPQPPAPQYGAPSGYDAQYESRDRDRDRGRHDSMRSPTHHRQRGRSRSRSPGRTWGNQGSPFSPRARDTGGRFGELSIHQSLGDRRYDDARHEYRQRSPHRRERSPSPVGRSGPVGMRTYDPNDIPSPEQVPKFIDYDQNLGPDKIKVLSRTLFVGGVSCSEAELKKIFSQFGYVQSCIVNQEKRHAFVKMITRQHALAAKEAMEEKGHREGGAGLAQDGLPFRQCRWGVGYGPRDCSDYSTGISKIPIERLTEADKRWMLTAPYGGSGGREIVAGLVVEEPDIEIGAGVSSKAISRRVGGEKGSHKKGGKFEQRKGKFDDDGSRGGWGHGNKDREGHGRGSGSRDIDNPNNMPVAERRPGGGGGRDSNNGQPEVEGLPFGLSFGPNGEIQYPPGFRFPDPNSSYAIISSPQVAGNNGSGNGPERMDDKEDMIPRPRMDGIGCILESLKNIGVYGVTLNAVVLGCTSSTFSLLVWAAAPPKQ